MNIFIYLICFQEHYGEIEDLVHLMKTTMDYEFRQNYFNNHQIMVRTYLRSNIPGGKFMIKLKIAKFVIVATVYMCISSCTATNINSNYNLENITSVEQARSQITNGMSFTDVQNKWGNPNLKQTNNNQTEWTYNYQTSSLSLSPKSLLSQHIPKKSKGVTIYFINGIVSDVGYGEYED
jgi:outer membrane protein assembly factor BamE (lipoprotein component of BamABCDE complex)